MPRSFGGTPPPVRAAAEQETSYGSVVSSVSSVSSARPLSLFFFRSLMELPEHGHGSCPAASVPPIFLPPTRRKKNEHHLFA